MHGTTTTGLTRANFVPGASLDETMILKICWRGVCFLCYDIPLMETKLNPTLPILQATRFEPKLLFFVHRRQADSTTGFPPARYRRQTRFETELVGFRCCRCVWNLQMGHGLFWHFRKGQCHSPGPNIQWSEDRRIFRNPRGSPATRSGNARHVAIGKPGR